MIRQVVSNSDGLNEASTLPKPAVVQHDILPASDPNVTEKLKIDPSRVTNFRQLVFFYLRSMPGGSERRRIEDPRTHREEMVERFKAARCQLGDYLAGHSIRYLSETPKQFFAAIDEAISKCGGSPIYFANLQPELRRIKRPEVATTTATDEFAKKVMPLALRVYQELRNQGYSHHDLADLSSVGVNIYFSQPSYTMGIKK